MHNDNSIHFQGKDPSEVLQFYFRQHWIRMVKPLATVVFFTALLLVIGWLMLWSVELDQSTTRHSILLLLLAFMLAVQFRFLNRFYCYFMYLIIVTDRKVHRIKKNLLTLDTHQSVDMWSLQDLKKSQRGPIQNLFGFGTIILEAYSENQMSRDTGGPKDLDMLMTVDKLRREFPNCEPAVLREIEREVSEGEGHTGMASVVQFIARKKA